MAEPARLIQTVSRAAMIVTVAVTMAVMMYCNVLEGEGVGGWNIKLRNDSFLSPSVKEKEKVFLLFVIPTLPNNCEQRKAIRETWASGKWSNLSDIEPYYKTFKIMFIVANLDLKKNSKYDERFLEEVKTHNDIWINDILNEERRVLKYKVIWGMLRSLQEFDFDYLVKTDDDIFVDLPLLLRYMIPLNRTNTYTGNCKFKYGGWDEFPVYPYCSGGGYVLSQDVVSAIMLINKKVRVMIRPEDGYTGYLIHLLNTEQGRGITPLLPPNGVIEALKFGYKCGISQALFWHKMGGEGKMLQMFGILNGDLSPVEC